MQTRTIARPLRITGRIVLGPRHVRSGYARLVAIADGSGRIELYDPDKGAWCEASGQCSFGELWSASPVLDSKSLAAMTRDLDE